MQLHYPAKEKAAKEEGVVKFYCEISPEGKPGHISTLYGKGQQQFGKAVEFALHHGSFNPAAVDSKPVAVLLGGTVLFLIDNGHPTIAVSLTTAESDKIAKMANYQQPQMLDSDALFRRKIFAHRDKYHLRYGAHPGAVVRAHVDAQGKLVGKSIESESPPNGGHAAGFLLSATVHCAERSARSGDPAELGMASSRRHVSSVEAVGAGDRDRCRDDKDPGSVEPVASRC